MTHGSLTDKQIVEETQTKPVTWLNLIHRSFFLGVQKAWILHHLLIPKMKWTLLIYHFPFSIGQKMEQKISSFLRKWFRLSPSISSLSLYSSSTPCPMPLTSLTNVLTALQISGYLLLRDSEDSVVKSAFSDSSRRSNFCKSAGRHC